MLCVLFLHNNQISDPHDSGSSKQRCFNFTVFFPWLGLATNFSSFFFQFLVRTKAIGRKHTAPA